MGIAESGAVAEFAGVFPFEDEFAEALDGGRVFVFLPDQDKGNALDGFEEDETEAGTLGDDGFGDDADAGTGFDVAHDCADEARGMGQARANACAAATGDYGIVEAHAFAAGEDDEWQSHTGMIWSWGDDTAAVSGNIRS